MMQVCTMASGHTLLTTSGSPFRPSQTTKKVSFTPRLRRSVSTASRSPSRLTPMAA
jgi:hypothetical protein